MHDEFKVINKTEVSSSFNPGRLIRDLTSCFGHKPEKAVHAYWLEQTIEDKLLSLKKLTLTTQEIAAIAYEVIAAFDSLAGDQYAARHHRLLK